MPASATWSEGSVWYTWTSDTSSSAYTASDVSGAVWSSWVSNVAAGTSVTDTVVYVWQRWSDESVGDVVIHTPRINPASIAVTAEEIARQREEAQRRAVQLEEQRKRAAREREEARQRAEALLVEHLDGVQRQQFESEKSFVVRGMSGKRYRLRYILSGNIDELDEEDRVVARYCVHPNMDVPVADSLLAQKLWLEADEKKLLKIANRHAVPYQRAAA